MIMELNNQNSGLVNGMNIYLGVHLNDRDDFYREMLEHLCKYSRFL